MYTNRPQRCTSSQQPKFKLPPFQEDNKLAFVDSVCSTLMTSRFGWGAMYTLNPRFRGTADEPFDYLDVLKEETIGWHDAATFLGRKGENHLRKRVATRIGQVALINRNGASFASLGRDGPTLKPRADEDGSPLPRGSPTFSGTFFFASSFATLASFARDSGSFHAKPANNAKKTQNKSWDV
jgi:hypothetical protein